MKSETVYLRVKTIYLCYSLCDVSHIFVHVFIMCMYNKFSCSSRTTTVLIRTRNTVLFCLIKKYLTSLDLTMHYCSKVIRSKKGYDIPSAEMQTSGFKIL